MYISQVSGERLQDHWSSGLKGGSNVEKGGSSALFHTKFL